MCVCVANLLLPESIVEEEHDQADEEAHDDEDEVADQVKLVGQDLLVPRIPARGIAGDV